MQYYRNFCLSQLALGQACLSIGLISHLIYLSFRSADTEAPDQRTRYLKKKKNKKKKKKKKPVESTADVANVSSESLEEVKTESPEPGVGISLISCGSDRCQKKFTSESALKYHVTFAHERIQTPNSTSDRNVSTTDVVSDDRNSKTPEAMNDTNSVTSQCVPNDKERLSQTNSIKTERIKPKTFPSTQNIRPILPTQAQSPQIAGSLLKPIQPKPTILPPPTKNLNLDNLKKPLLAKNPGSWKSNERDSEVTATAMDLTCRENKPACSPPAKPKTPIISVKSEFNTGNKQSLTESAGKEELEVLKHVNKAGPAMSVFSSPLLAPGASEYLNLLPPGFMMPPSSTASHLLPGLMGLPPPPASPISPFGASLESLARAAEERARTFGPFSPAHPTHPLPTPSPGRSPGGGAGGGAGTGGGGTGAGGGQTNTSEGGDPPLLRHEHMHTHLHYITSPTHP